MQRAPDRSADLSSPVEHVDTALKWLAAIVDSSDDAILSKNLDGIITSWNQGAQRIFGYTAEEMIGKPVTLLMPPDRVDEEPGILQRIRNGERVDHYETVRRRKDGSLLNISLTVSPIKNAEGRIIGASKIARDITDRKRAESALREAKEQLSLANGELVQAKAGLEQQVQLRTAELRQTNEQLEELVYTIAHDLRAPMRAMQAFARLLLEDYGQQLDDIGKGYSERIVRSAASMDEMVRDLLEYGRVARAELALRPVDVRAAWNSAIGQNEQAILERGARIKTMPPLPRVLAHEGTLVQVLANLLSNAVKFVPTDTVPEVRIWSDPPSQGMARIHIRDNGIGISAKHSERIFRVFERLDGDLYGGTGIGLSIVRKGVERMNGRVGLASTPGKGTEFWIELPEAA